jgi:hypothetical protein
MPDGRQIIAPILFLDKHTVDEDRLLRIPREHTITKRPFVTSSAFYLFFAFFTGSTLMAGAIISIGGEGSPS